MKLPFGYCLLLTLIPFVAKSQPAVSQPGYYRIKLGSIEVVALSDGTVPIDATKLLITKNPAGLVQQLEKNGLANPVEISINTYLIISGSKIILVDTGSGKLFGPNGGMLPASLKSAGYKAEDITDILITHIHADHSGGLSIDNHMMFPNAIIHVNQKELDFWAVHEQVQANDTRGYTSNRPSYFALKPYLKANRVNSFSGNAGILPGITTIEKTGHTAGHTMYCLESDGQKLVFVGDLVHIEQVQFHDAGMMDEFDFDQQTGAKQRLLTYAELAKSGYLIAAAHISFPGVGRMLPDGDGYKWMPVPYSILGRVR